jgi:NAD(P)-dependent dehydrogenase (short-subunit alcohol dehydrogenase family)
VVALPRIIAKRWPGAGIDVLVNNAGLGRNNAALWDGSTASWVEMISTNVLGVCMCTREVLKVKVHPASSQPCLPEEFCAGVLSARDPRAHKPLKGCYSLDSGAPNVMRLHTTHMEARRTMLLSSVGSPHVYAAPYPRT